MNRRDFLRNLATITAGIAAAPALKVAAAALAPAGPIARSSAIVEFPTGRRYHTIWLKCSPAFAATIEQIRIKFDGKIVDHYLPHEFRLVVSGLDIGADLGPNRPLTPQEVPVLTDIILSGRAGEGVSFTW
jgi:hypothetical protein